MKSEVGTVTEQHLSGIPAHAGIPLQLLARGSRQLSGGCVLVLVSRHQANLGAIVFSLSNHLKWACGSSFALPPLITSNAVMQQTTVIVWYFASRRAFVDRRQQTFRRIVPLRATKATATNSFWWSLLCSKCIILVLEAYLRTPNQSHLLNHPILL